MIYFFSFSFLGTQGDIVLYSLISLVNQNFNDMKKIILFLSAGTFFFVSCNNNADKSSGNANAQAVKNLAAENGVNKAIQTGDVSKLGDYIAADGVDHSGQKGDVKGLDSIKAELAMIHSMVKDMKSEVIKELADSEYVFQWMKFTGTSDGSMGPKGPFNMTAVEVSKFNKEGKCTDHWEFISQAEMMKMMPPPPVSTPDKK